MKVKKEKISISTILVGLVVVFAIIMFFSYDKASNDLKSIVFDQYTTLEFGEAVDKNISNAKWSSEKIDSTFYRVTISGFSPFLYSNVSATFNVNYDNDMVYAAIDHALVDGEYVDDLISLAMVMGVICA